MWPHPALRQLLRRPELLAEHLGAYGERAAADAQALAAALQSRLLLQGAALGCALLGLGLGGMALLLAAVLPLATMPAPWALAAVPALPLAVAAALWLRQRRHAPALDFPALRERWQEDRARWQRPPPSGGDAPRAAAALLQRHPLAAVGLAAAGAAALAWWQPWAGPAGRRWRRRLRRGAKAVLAALPLQALLAEAVLVLARAATPSPPPPGR